MALTHNGSSNSYSVDAYLLGREVLSWTLDEDKRGSFAGFGTTGVGGGQPTGFLHTSKFGSTQTQMTDFNNADVLREVYEAQPDQSVRPSGALSTTSPSTGDRITWTASNYDGVSTYVCTITKDSDGTVLSSGSDFSQVGDNVTFDVPQFVGGISLNVIGVSAGLRRSQSERFQMTTSASVNSYRYLKISGVETNGTPTHKQLGVREVQIYSLPSLQGTDNPTQAWSSGSVLPFTISQGIGTGGNAWDDNTNTQWSSAGLTSSQASLNYAQIAFSQASGAQPMGSLRIVASRGSKSAPAIKVEVSNDGSTWTTWTTLTGLTSGTTQANFDENSAAP